MSFSFCYRSLLRYCFKLFYLLLLLLWECLLSRRNTVLRRQARKNIYNVSEFMKKEAEKGIEIDLKHVQKRITAATGVSVWTVRRINAEANKSDLCTVFRTPGQKRNYQP